MAGQRPSEGESSAAPAVFREKRGGNLSTEGGLGGIGIGAGQGGKRGKEASMLGFFSVALSEEKRGIVNNPVDKIS
jgi:hypothetical protein